MNKLDFNKLIGHRLVMDKTTYTIEGRGGIHIGNINTVKLSTPSLVEGKEKEFEYRVEATVIYRLDNGQAQILPPAEEQIKLGSK